MITDEEFARIFRDGLRMWNEHKFFECHDKLEEAWKEVKHEKKKDPGSDPRRDFTHGIILLAVAFYHWRNKNSLGALRKYDDAVKLLSPYRKPLEGVDPKALLNRVKKPFANLRRMAATPFDNAFVPALPLENAKSTR